MIILTNLATVPCGEGSALSVYKAILPIVAGGGPVTGADPAAKVSQEHDQKNTAPSG